MARVRRSATANASHPNYRLLFLIASFILVLNINQTLRLERDLLEQWSFGSLIRKSSSSKVDDRLRRTPYFSQPRRIYKAISLRKDGLQKAFVKPGDYIYFKNLEHWDSAPIIIESHKLVFFSIPKVGCTVWKQLFRRMLGYEDWISQDAEKGLPHNPENNGLKYLWDYDVQKASEIMTSPEWTRAIMVRDPKQRFLSAFLDKAVSNDHLFIRDHCCPDESCINDAQTAVGFLKLCGTCEDEHWKPQHERLDGKYWPYIDWVGHVENAAADAKALLTKVGAWEEFGKSGWGKEGNLPIFGSKGLAGAGEHATWAEWQVWKWFTPLVEEDIEKYYQADYENPLFNFTQGVCFTCVD